MVGIGNTNPNATLDISASNTATPSNSDGILIPRTDEFPTTAPGANQDGMLLFITGNGTPTKGLYYWDNTAATWISVVGSRSINDLSDGNSDVDGSEDGSSIFLGMNAGGNDDLTNNRNVGIGFNGMFSNTSGRDNIAVGYNSLYSNVTGIGNTALGTLALTSNTSNFNTAVGAYSLRDNTTGDTNSSFGYAVLANNENGVGNTALGGSSMTNNISGSRNVGVGIFTLYENTTASHNVGVGSQALRNNLTGESNVGVGLNALYTNTSGSQNIAIGSNTLYNNTSGNDNIAMGFESLLNNSTGGNNHAYGSLSLRENTTGFFNNAFGRHALQSNTTGSGNTAMGHGSLRDNNIGSNNTAMGNGAGDNVNGDNNVFIGHNAGVGLANSTNSGNVIIGNQAGSGANYNNRLYIDNSNTTSPLLYGEFDNDLIRVNGNQEIIDNTNQTYALSVQKSSNSVLPRGINIIIDQTGAGLGAVHGISTTITKTAASSNASEVVGIYNLAQNLSTVAFTSNAYGSLNIGTRRGGLGIAYGSFNRGNLNSGSASSGNVYGSYNVGNCEFCNTVYGIYAETYASFMSPTEYAGYFNGDVYSSGSYLPSARKLKRNIQPLITSVEKLKSLDVKQYSYQTNTYSFMKLPKGTQTGFIAEEIAKIYPELVKKTVQPGSTKEGIESGLEKPHDKVEFLAVNYTGLIPHLVKAIQEQQDIIDTQEETIISLISRVERLESLSLNRQQ